MPSGMSPSINACVPKESSENDLCMNISGMMGSSVLCDSAINQAGSPTMRELVTEYWCAEHKEATLENMLLDSKAATIDALERPEVLSKLPSVRGLRVLELGAGIGRFTRVLAEQGCKELVAVDFQDTACEENRRVNENNPNVQVICQDATTLEFEAESFDFIFSNWLLMYLSDGEVAAFFVNCLKWLKPGGKLFFRESCMHRSGDAARSFNPSRYRHPTEYFNTALTARISDASMRFCVLEHGRIATYVKVKNNPNQFYWMLRKVSSFADCASSSELVAERVPGGRQLLTVGEPVQGLSEYLCTLKSTQPPVHVISCPNVLTVVDIQALSATPELFSLEIVDELAQIKSGMPASFVYAHFHGFKDSIDLRAFALKVSSMITSGARVTGLPEEISELLNALTAA